MTIKRIVFSFLRMQPPTLGHELVMNKVKHVAGVLSADHIVHLSKTCDSDKNPIMWEEKLKYATCLFPDINFSMDRSVMTPFKAMEMFGKLGYKEVVLVVGSDRTNDFAESMQSYLDEWKIDKLRIISAGERNMNNDISATVARNAVKNNQFTAFTCYIPGDDKSMKCNMFESIQKKYRN